MSSARRPWGCRPVPRSEAVPRDLAAHLLNVACGKILTGPFWLFLWGRLETNQLTSVLPDGPVVNCFVADDPDAALKPDFGCHARAEIRRNRSDMECSPLIIHACHLPVLRIGRRAPIHKMRSAPRLPNRQRETKIRCHVSGGQFLAKLF